MAADVPDYTLTRKRIKNLRLTVKAPHGEVVVSAAMDEYLPDWQIRRRALNGS